MTNRMIFIVALLGTVLTVHLWIQKERGFDQGCLGFSSPIAGLATSSECQKVVESGAGSIFGVDNIALGFWFYVVVAALSLVRVFSSPRKSQWIQRAGLTLTGLALAVTLYLVYLQLFDIKTICVLCLGSAVLVGSLFALQVVEFVKPASGAADPDPATMVRELGLFAVFSFLAAALLVGDLFFVNQIGTASLLRGRPAQDVRQVVDAVLQERIDERFLQAMAPCTYDDTKPAIDDFQKLISSKDPFLGNPNAAITVIEFFDPNCPHCKRLHPELKRVAEKYRTQARFYFKPFPLWRYSVEQIEAMWLAAEQGKYFEMVELQFRMQRRGGLPANVLLALADSLKLDKKAFAEGLRTGRYRAEVLQYRNLLDQVGIRSAPKVLLNGRFVGARGQTITEGCLSRLIAQELQSNGASRPGTQPRD